MPVEQQQKSLMTSPTVALRPGQLPLLTSRRATLTLKLDQRNKELPGRAWHNMTRSAQPFPVTPGPPGPLAPSLPFSSLFSPLPSWVSPLKQPCEHSPRLDVSAPAYISYKPLSSPWQPSSPGYSDGQLSTGITSPARPGKGWLLDVGKDA